MRTLTIDQVCNCLERACMQFERAGADAEADSWRRAQDHIHREFARPSTPDASCGRLLIGQGDDTYDPLCALPRGHEGRCRPSEMYMP